MKFTSLAVAAALVIAAPVCFAQDDVPQSGPAENGSPAWFIYKPPAGGTNLGRIGKGVPDVCGADVQKWCTGKTGQDALICLYGAEAEITKECKTGIEGSAFRVKSPDVTIPICDHSPICTYDTGAFIGRFTNPDGVRNGIGSYIRVEWKSDPVNLGYKPVYPLTQNPEYRGGDVSVAIDHHDNIWVFERNAPGQPQLFKYSADHKLLVTVGENVIGHQVLAHGVNVDANDNVWICDEYGSTVMELSPEGKLLRTLGVRGHRGDWIEKTGQRLIWQPVAITFAPNGDIYLGEGHANESPNDLNGDDPASQAGVARVIHFDKNANFINQWYGNYQGPGKFYQVHDIAVDPRNGNVWVGDREQYRLQVFTANGQFIKTVAMRNLTCNLTFDAKGELWIATGGDGQYLHISREGKVLGAIGNGPGRGDGQEGETGYIRWDSHGNMWTGDTGIARVTEWVKPG